MLIVIDGIDGSGKATQSEILCNTLVTEGKKVRKISFPNYQSNSSALVKMYLSGEFGANPDDVNAYAASSFYAVDRFASYKKDWGKAYENGEIIIADRYTTSNAIHQCTKLPAEQREEFLGWLYDYEYNKLGIPAPDLVIYLDVSPNVSQKMMTKRYHEDESQKDIHEANITFMKKSREAAHYCMARDGWIHIICDDGEQMLSKEEIAEKVRKAVKHVVE